MGCVVEARESQKVVVVFHERGFDVVLVDEDERTRTLLERIEL